MNETFFLTLGIMSALGCLLLVAHLLQPNLRISSLGQGLRYLTFFAYSATIAYAGAELIQDNVERHMRHVFYLICTVLLIITVLVSMYETKNDKTE